MSTQEIGTLMEQCSLMYEHVRAAFNRQSQGHKDAADWHLTHAMEAYRRISAMVESESSPR